MRSIENTRIRHSFGSVQPRRIVVRLFGQLVPTLWRAARSGHLHERHVLEIMAAAAEHPLAWWSRWSAGGEILLTGWEVDLRTGHLDVVLAPAFDDEGEEVPLGEACPCWMLSPDRCRKIEEQF